LHVSFSRACLMAVVCLATGTIHASAQEKRHYRLEIGCPFADIGSMPANISLSQLQDKCGFGPSTTANSGQEAATVRQKKSEARTTPKVIESSDDVAPSSDARRFRVYEGRDIDGQDLKIISNVTWSNCNLSCLDNSRCIGYSYDKWNNYCFLKKSIPTSLRVEPKAMVAILSSSRPHDDSDTLTMQRFRKRAFNTKPFQVKDSNEFTDCEDSCRNNSRCEVFSFVNSSHQCRLIRKPASWVPDTSIDSGVKRQIP